VFTKNLIKNLTLSLEFFEEWDYGANEFENSLLESFGKIFVHHKMKEVWESEICRQ
jgi:hypothetical protein